MRANGSKCSGRAIDAIAVLVIAHLGLITLSACGSSERIRPDWGNQGDTGTPGETAGPTDLGKGDVNLDPGPKDAGPIHVSDRCFPDKDSDGWPVKGTTVEADVPGVSCPPGYTFLLTFEDGLVMDCDDETPTTYPGALELCNLVDDDCDGSTDEDLVQDCMDNCGKPGVEICENGQWTPCSAGGKVCCEGERKNTTPCPPFDFVFVTDNSGSMTGSDPNDIRYAAVKVFIQNMDNDTGHIMAFDDQVQHFGPPTDDKALLLAFLEQARSQGAGGATDIDGALYEAFSVFLDPDAKDVVVLLTDGHDTTDPDAYVPATLKLEAETKGIRVYILGLGYAVNTPALQQTVTKDGGYFFAAHAEEILKIYDDIFALTNYEYWVECNDKGEWIEKWGDCGD